MTTIKQEIRNRWTNAVQFTADITCAPDATIGVRIGLAVMWARQNDANLSGANLSGAKWRGITITRAPLQLWGLRWLVTFIDEHMQIGCQIHPLADWAAFDDAAIAAMDGRDALRFWRANKAALFALAAADGRWGQQ